MKDVSAALTRADHGGMLNTRELLDIAGLLTASRRVSEYDRDRQGEATVLDHYFSALHTNKYLEDRIRGAILDEETIADTASPELADIRRKMRVAATKGRQILQRIISSPSYAKVLQEALITQRDGRFVVPVKAECKGSLPGLVHDISSSGATLFVEPDGRRARPTTSSRSCRRARSARSSASCASSPPTAATRWRTFSMTMTSSSTST